MDLNFFLYLIIIILLIIILYKIFDKCNSNIVEEFKGWRSRLSSRGPCATEKNALTNCTRQKNNCNDQKNNCNDQKKTCTDNKNALNNKIRNLKAQIKTENTTCNKKNDGLQTLLDEALEKIKYLNKNDTDTDRYTMPPVEVENDNDKTTSMDEEEKEEKEEKEDELPQCPTVIGKIGGSCTPLPNYGPWRLDIPPKMEINTWAVYNEIYNEEETIEKTIIIFKGKIILLSDSMDSMSVIQHNYKSNISDAIVEFEKYEDTPYIINHDIDWNEIDFDPSFLNYTTDRTDRTDRTDTTATTDTFDKNVLYKATFYLLRYRIK